ncbi:MAG: SDR family oxidoreductase [Gammaproteobacteria bacterium]|nr:MAG: SDR family oxidoreductase [Gammaproteobacteria bacterium]
MDISEYYPREAFANRTVFITGGGSGINLGIAKSFAAVGAKVAICGRNEEKLDDAKGELEALGVKAHAVVADVRDYDALQDACDEIQGSLGPITDLVCGAAGNFLCPANEMSANAFRTIVDIDLNGSFNACRAAFEQLKETKGCVLMVSAGQAYVPYSHQAHAGAAKAGVENLAKNLALEWGHYGIRVNTVVPGPIEGTEGVKRLTDEKQKHMLLQSIPLKRLGLPEEIGQAAVFLSSPMAAYITGSQIVCDGGMNLSGSALFNMGLTEKKQSSQKSE